MITLSQILWDTLTQTEKTTYDNGQMDFLGLCDSASVLEYKIS